MMARFRKLGDAKDLQPLSWRNSRKMASTTDSSSTSPEQDQPKRDNKQFQMPTIFFIPRTGLPDITEILMLIVPDGFKFQVRPKEARKTAA
jgi:hypothetical protein